MATFAGAGGELESQAVPSHERGILPGRGRAPDGDTRPGCPPGDTLPGPGDRVSSWQGAWERRGAEAQPLDQQGASELSVRLQPRLSVLFSPDMKAPAGHGAESRGAGAPERGDRPQDREGSPSHGASRPRGGNF